MTPPPSTPKKTRRVQPKIIGHTSPTPRVSGTTARSSLRALAGTLSSANSRPAVRPPVGAPGMHGFPRARTLARDSQPQGALAVSVARALRDQAEAEAAAAIAAAAEIAAAMTAAPEPALIDANKSKARRTRNADPVRAPAARPTVRGRPTTPDEQPLTHAPAAERPTEPPLRTTLARPQAEAAIACAQASHRPVRRRTEIWARDPSRPRPSRVLAELNAALADDAAAAE